MGPPRRRSNRRSRIKRKRKLSLRKNKARRKDELGALNMSILTSLESQITGAVEKLSESVVSIDSVRVTRDFAYGVVLIEGKGSGLVIDSKVYVITNNHVIDGAAKVQIHLKDGRSFVGEVVGSDPSTDIAVIHVEAENLPAAILGDSEQLKVGQLALAIGNTLGLQGGPTVSLGVVSALGRPLPGADFIFEGLIQTDTAINPGNSGGPLADIIGNVIGMNTAMIPYAQGVGFAIPVNTIKWVMQQIREKGRVVRPWLGIYGTTLNEALARRYDHPARILWIFHRPNVLRTANPSEHDARWRQTESRQARETPKGSS